MAMTHKERIDAVLSFQPTDRTPFCLVADGAWISKMTGRSYRDLYSSPDGGAADIVKYTNEIDVDIVSGVNGVFTAPLAAWGCAIQIDEPGNPTNTGSVIKDPETEIPLLDKSKIRETLLANDFFQGMLRQCRSIKELVGDDKYLLGDIAGPFTDASVLVGTAKCLKLMRKNPALLHQLVDYCTYVAAEVFHLLHENGCDITFVAEPVASGTMISPQMYDEWALPYLKKLLEMLPEYKYHFAHVCGASLARVIPLRDAGLNAFSCDYLVPQDEAMRDADGKMVIFGNMNPAGNLLTRGADEVYEEACEHIRVAKDQFGGLGYILAPGCDLGAPTAYDNVMAMSRACKDLA